jgi:phosphoribosylformylglycinamidine cyclo-ligase
MREGHVVIGVVSSGVHSNGYSLVRRVAQQSGIPYTGPSPFSDQTLGDALMTPTKLYVKGALAAIRSGHVNGLAHITGGGITENLPRCLPAGLDAEIDLETWTPPAVFGWLANSAGIEQAEMLRTFNCGIGLVAVTDMMSSGHVIDAFQESGNKAMRIGTLVSGDGDAKVVYRGSLKL